MRQAELTRLLKVDHGTLSRWSSGYTFPREEEMQQRIAAACPGWSALHQAWHWQLYEQRRDTLWPPGYTGPRRKRPAPKAGRKP